MVVVAQLVRASDCDSEGRGFEPHHPPKILLKCRIFFVPALIFDKKERIMYIKNLLYFLQNLC